MEIIIIKNKLLANTIYHIYRYTTSKLKKSNFSIFFHFQKLIDPSTKLLITRRVMTRCVYMYFQFCVLSPRLLLVHMDVHKQLIRGMHTILCRTVFM